MMRSGSDGSDNEEHQSIEVVNMDDEEDELLPNVEIDNDFDDNEIKNNFENYAQAENIPVLTNPAVNGSTIDINKSIDSQIHKAKPQDFQPISILGKGSFGEVYLVEKDLMEYYAMKVLQKEKILGNIYIKYALTERNVLSYTQHPFIV